MSVESDIAAIVSEQQAKASDALRSEAASLQSVLSSREQVLRGEVEAFYLGQFGGSTNADVRSRDSLAPTGGYSLSPVQAKGLKPEPPWALLLGLAALYYLMTKRRFGRGK